MQAQTRPRFRHDHLIAELVEEQNARFVDVMDPDSGNMFRFYEVEYSLACAMDGERDVAGIVKWAQDELGLAASASEVQAVISTLTGLQFIDTTAADGKVAKAARTAATDELAPGVVVGKAAAAQAPHAPELELGHSGPQTAVGASEDLPKADFDLGAPGAAAAKQAPAKPVEDIGLGAPGARQAAKAAQSDVSIDLTDHLSIKPADVKEAVRASKVMQAVEVPKDLMEAMEPAAKAPAEKPAPKQEPATAAKAEAKKPVDKPIEKVAAKAPVEAKQPAAKAAKPAEKKPVELPTQPATSERAKSAVPIAPSSGPSPVLVIFLILVVVGAGAFFVWKYVINKPDQAAPAPSAKVLPPPPAPEITATINVETPPPAEIKAAAAGAIEAIEAADKDVTAGDTIAWLAGAKALQTEIGKLTADVEKLQPAITTAETALSDAQQKENNEAGVTAAQAKLDAAKKPLDVKKSALTQKQGELDQLAVKALLDGKLVEPASVGDKVEAGDVVVKIAQPAAPVASFKVPPGVKLPADNTVPVASAQAAGSAPVACKIVDVQAETVKVSCPSDPSFADGSTVKLVLP